VLGSVAGDDTILVIATETRGGAALSKEFRDLSGLGELNEVRSER
jgi:arginine repressor